MYVKAFFLFYYYFFRRDVFYVIKCIFKVQQKILDNWTLSAKLYIRFIVFYLFIMYLWIHLFYLSVFPPFFCILLAGLLLQLVKQFVPWGPVTTSTTFPAITKSDPSVLFWKRALSVWGFKTAVRAYPQSPWLRKGLCIRGEKSTEWLTLCLLGIYLWRRGNEKGRGRLWNNPGHPQ